MDEDRGEMGKADYKQGAPKHSGSFFSMLPRFTEGTALLIIIIISGQCRKFNNVDLWRS